MTDIISIALNLTLDTHRIIRGIIIHIRMIIFNLDVKGFSPCKIFFFKYVNHALKIAHDEGSVESIYMRLMSTDNFIIHTVSSNNYELRLN